MGSRTRSRTTNAAARPPGADLLTHVRHDLIGCDLERRSSTVAVVTTPTGTAFEVEVRRERRKLIDLHVLAVHVQGASATPTDAAVVFHHRGQVRRTGLGARVRGNDPPAVALRDHLMADGELERASLPLDFTSFEVRHHGGGWRATLELMGGSYVRTTFPPAAHYVRLHADQVEALLATVAVLHEHLPGRNPTPAGASGPAPARPVSGHLPRRQE